MKFSIIYEAQMVDTSRQNEAQVFQDMVDQCLLAEEMDFDCIWSVEHHCLTQYAHLSAPESFLAFIAGATTRIHVGHGVVCLPFNMNHPIKVAERVATLDLLSQGRVHFGVGKGGTIQETGAFGTKMEDVTPQVDESMYLIPKMWMQDTIEHHGLINIPERPIHPKPYQDPHPLMYMACTREDSLRVAGSRGLGALVMGFNGPYEIAERSKVYRKAFAERKAEDQVGFRPNNHLAALCATVVLEDREKARRVGIRGQRFFAESIRYWYAGGEKPSVADLNAEEQFAELKASEERLVAYLGEQAIPVTPDARGNYNIAEDAYGTPDDCIRHVEQLIAAGADEILFLVQMGTIPHEITMESIRNIGKHVIPHFRAKAEAAEYGAMFKVICLISRKPGMAREDFQRHYETVHVPLVRSLVPALVEYRRNYVDPADWFVVPGAGEPDFDSVTEMWFHDRAGYETMTALNADPVKGKALADDAAMFLDAGKTRMLVVGEHS